MGKLLLLLAALIFTQLLEAAAYYAPDSPIIPDQQYDPLPPWKEGVFPIHIPDYQGVDQLLLLSNRWVIVVVSNTELVKQKINELTNGQYFEAISLWRKTYKTDHPNWVAWHGFNDFYETFSGKARDLAGERDLDKPDYFNIESQTDAQYSTALSPIRTTRYIASIAGPKNVGDFDIFFAHYCYLELPKPLQNGETYTITLKNGKSVTFLYDENRTVSRAIKVNQLGYLPDCSQKYAYLGCYLQEFGPMDVSQAKEYSVISVETGKTVLKGELKLRAENRRLVPKQPSDPSPYLTGENTYEIDLNPLKEEGEFFISIPGIGRSWTFRHSNDVYGEAFYIAARGLYHQRCGIAIGQPYSAWPRYQCHTDPIYESENIAFITPILAPEKFDAFDVIGATLDKSRKTDDATGGWHDAADWDRNINHYMNIFDMLYAYQLFPQKFLDNQLNLPESGNGIPDILKEVEYGLRPWRKSMDARNGVSGSIETNTHPPMIDPEQPYAYAMRTRWSSLIYAAAAAQYAYLVKPFNQQMYDEYSQSAIKAFEFGIDPKNSLGKITIHAAENRGHGEKYTVTFEENDENLIPFVILSRLQLFLLTDDLNYLGGVNDLLDKVRMPYDWPFTAYVPWTYFSIFSEKVYKHIPLTTRIKFAKHYIEKADENLALMQDQAYRQSWYLNRDYWMSWSATTMTNYSRQLLTAYFITNDKKYRDAAIVNADFMLGNNPMGMSWTTSLGFVYPIAIQHAVSELDHIPDPVPGITIYGITEAMYYDLRHFVWETAMLDGSRAKFMPEQNFDVPVWRKWSCHPHLNTPQCEFTIDSTMSSTIFTSAMLMPDHWLPSEELKKRNPREEHLLFGNWYLP